MLKWIYRRNQRKRIMIWEDVINNYEKAEQSGFDSVALIFPVVVAGISQKLAVPDDMIFAPVDISMERRLMFIRWLDSEADRIAAIDATEDSRMPMLYCHDILYVVHRACFHQADQPMIEPELSCKVAERAVRLSSRLFERGKQQINQLYSPSIPDQKLN
ncbi:hypothetical protein [Yoonia maritima]|uniref:hypothetical protein n=1 Tax=Yoonia maritima TaxID=1435347 RepID=UPI000D0E5265|nr:hypothetical protein [Yoonia maritima]